MSRVNYVKSQLWKYQLCYDSDSQAQLCQFQLCKYQLCARPIFVCNYVPTYYLSLKGTNLNGWRIEISRCRGNENYNIIVRHQLKPYSCQMAAFKTLNWIGSKVGTREHTLKHKQDWNGFHSHRLRNEW